jgi:imidazolonepropionase-like amidohydrolase
VVVGMWRLPATLLPDGDEQQLWTSAAGRLTHEPVAGAEALPGRFALPGLVDAHVHLTLAAAGDGPVPAGREHRDRVLAASRSAGVLLLRDAGGDPELTLELARDPGSGVVAAGRFLAADGYYFPQLHEPVGAGQLTAAALAQVRAGAQWVKLVGDFPYRLERGVAHTPTYPVEAVRGMVEAVHAAGARVAAHTNTAHVAELVAAGIDSVEHGYGLDEAALRVMAGTGAAWTPTLSAAITTHPGDPEHRRHAAAERVELLRRLLPLAVRLGVPVLTGTDVVGSVTNEVVELVRCGLSPVDALRAATTGARAFLGRPALLDGAPADVVTYEHDPREDPAVLASPAAVVRNGRRVT